MSRKFHYSTLWNFNGGMLCAVDCKVTGEEAGFYDLMEISVLPLNSDIKPNPNFTPFSTLIKPKRVENYFNENKLKNQFLIAKSALDGLDPYIAADLFGEWFNKLELALGKKIIPLSIDWPLNKSFIVDWLGYKNQKHYFDHRYRDIQTIALFLNDRAEFQIEQIPYPKTFLQFLCSQLKIERINKNDSIADCATIAEVYRAILLRS